MDNFNFFDNLSKSKPYSSSQQTGISIFIVSFLILFLTFFLLLKFLGSTFSRITSVIGLKGVDRLLGLCFGTLKITAVLTSIYIYNLGFLDTKQWWLDSLTREYTIKFSESVEPILKDWEIGTSTFLNKDNLKFNL